MFHKAEYRLYASYTKVQCCSSYVAGTAASAAQAAVVAAAAAAVAAWHDISHNKTMTYFGPVAPVI